MHKLGDQWIETIDGKEHMLKAVKPVDLCQGCSFNCNQGGCCWAGFDDCRMGSKFIIRDLGILHAGLLPCPFCGEYPKVSSYGFRGEPKEYGIFHLCKDSYSKIETQHYATTQQAIDAWNRRV
jgi:hypothetical protein